MLHPPRIAHARGGNDHAGLLELVELPRFLRIFHISKAGKSKGIWIAREILLQLVVKAPGMTAYNAGSFYGHWAVYKNRHIGQALFVGQLIQYVQNLLSAP